MTSNVVTLTGLNQGSGPRSGGVSRRALVDHSDVARDFLRKVRIEAYDIDPHDLARLAGVSVGTIYAFRSGRTIWPRPSTLFPILEALGYRITLEKA